MADERGVFGRIWDYAMERVFPEAGEMLMQKTAQGSAEVAQALFHQSTSFTPYGSGQQPLEVEGPAQSYQDMLRDAAQRAAPEQDKGLER